MASVREQILGEKVMAKLETVRAALDWMTVVRNPRDPIGEEEWNAIVLLDGPEPISMGLTGFVEDRRVTFTIGMMVRERDGDTIETLLDAGYVAIGNALIDPADIQLGGLVIGVEQGETSEPFYGRTKGSARMAGGMTMDFTVRYLAREGDASTPGP